MQRTPLYDLYANYGAKTIDFGGWELPVQFSSIKEEHEAVRTKAGLFDVSHMGEVWITGADSEAFIQQLVTNDVSKLVEGKAMYAAMCYEDGGTVDDLLVYKFGPERFLLVVNASNIDKDVAWMKEHVTGDVQIDDQSAEWGLLALQGPVAVDILQPLTETDLHAVKFFTFTEGQVAGQDVIISRTGYTGEDGFELYARNEALPELWTKLLEAGAEQGLVPAGLGARDTLRFEACLPLYGQELSKDISPLEAGIGFAVKTAKESFIGKEAIIAKGKPRKLVGIEMIDTIGVSSIDELFADIPEKVRFKGEYAIKPAKSETALLKELTKMAAKNADSRHYASFLGAGVYDHFKPTIVDHVISRSEFYTAYTPYQPEISQGELQAIFEFQTMICELTGMELANSSMYDGGTALAEAGNLAAGHTRRKKILISEAVHPEYRDVVKMYAHGQNIAVEVVPHKDGKTDLDALQSQLSDDVAAVMVQYPNFFGQIEEMQTISDVTHEHGALFVSSSNPLALGVLTPPGKFGADITVGDAQVFGIPEAFGGPHCGYFAVSGKLMRKVPGRLVGETTDDQGRRGFVLTLQAREQHIRRDKATSNICSNQALNALAASVAMTALGKQGTKEMAIQNIAKTAYAKQAFEAAGLSVVFTGAHFNEIVVKLPGSIEGLNKHLLEKEMIGGLHLGTYYKDLQDHILIAVTEQRTKEEIDALVQEVGAYYA